MARRTRQAHAGQALVEYLLLITVVGIGCLAGIGYLRDSTATAYTRQQQALVAPTFVPSTYVAPTPTITATPTQATSGNGGGGNGGGANGGNGGGGNGGNGGGTANVVVATATPTSVAPTATAVATGSYSSLAQLTNSTTSGSTYSVQMKASGTSSADGVSARIFVNLSEYYRAGHAASDITINSDGFDFCGGSVSGWKTYNAATYMYYVEVTFSGEIQGAAGAYPWNDHCVARVRFANYSFGLWNGSNDPSQIGLSSSGYGASPQIPVYRNGTRVYGNEP